MYNLAVLDNVMKQCTLDNIGTVKHQANVISYEFEEKLWEQNIVYLVNRILIN